MDIKAFWHDVISKNKAALPAYFCDGAVIRWPCTNEQFTVEEYVRANCEYPGVWDGEAERLEAFGDTLIWAARVFPADQSASFHVVSFIVLKDDRIQTMDEYWADDGEAPAWRKKMRIGQKIR